MHTLLILAALVLGGFPLGDANHDGHVTRADLDYIAARWEKPAAEWVAGDGWADINGDGKINIIDLSIAGKNIEPDADAGMRCYPKRDSEKKHPPKHPLNLVQCGYYAHGIQ